MVYINNTQAKYINLSGSRITNLKVIDSNFQESYFLEATLKNIEFQNSNFSKSEFYKTNLDTIDFSTCEISGAKFDMKSLYGIIINLYQSEYLVSMLGVKIKDKNY